MQTNLANRVRAAHVSVCLASSQISSCHHSGISRRRESKGASDHMNGKVSVGRDDISISLVLCLKKNLKFLPNIL